MKIEKSVSKIRREDSKIEKSVWKIRHEDSKISGVRR